MTSLVTRCVAIAVAVCLAVPPAWGHTLPAARTVVVQVESCEAAVLIGYRPASGPATDSLLARIASQPKSQMLETAKSLLVAQALAPLTFAADGVPLVPTGVRAKLAADPSGARPYVVALVTFAIPPAARLLSASSADPRSTRISWTDRSKLRVDLARSPAQARWFAGVASFLLTLAAPTGVTCASSSTPSPP